MSVSSQEWWREWESWHLERDLEYIRKVKKENPAPAETTPAAEGKRMSLQHDEETLYELLRETAAQEIAADIATMYRDLVEDPEYPHKDAIRKTIEMIKRVRERRNREVK